MATPDPLRRSLYARLEEVLGATDADVMMTFLPQQPGSELATKADLDARFDRLEAVLDQRFEQVDRRFEQVDRRFEQVDQRFEQVDQRFERLDQRFEQSERRFERMEGRLLDGDRKFERMDERFGQVRDDLRDQLKVYTLTTIGAMTALTAIYAGVLVVAL